MSGSYNKRLRSAETAPEIENENENETSEFEIIKPNELNQKLLLIPKLSRQKDKIDTIDEMLTFIREIEYGDIENFISPELCYELRWQINEGKNQVQKKLLEVVGLIAERVSETSDQFYNRVLWYFQIEELLKQIEIILLKSIKSEDLKKQESDPYSSFIIQLVQIIIFIHKEDEIENKTIQSICGKIIVSQMNDLLNSLKQWKEDQKKKQQEQYQKEEEELQENEQNQEVMNNDIQTARQLNDELIEKKLKSATKTLKSIQYIDVIGNSMDFFIKQIKLHQVITPLFHINCPPKTNCSHSIILPESEILYNLQGSVFQVLALFSFDMKASEYLYKKLLIFRHVARTIIRFAGKYEHRKVHWFQLPTGPKTYQYIISPSSSSSNSDISSFQIQQIQLVIGALQLLYHHDSIFEPVNALSIDLDEALLKLTLFQRRNHSGDQFERQSSIIRKQSSECIKQIKVMINMIGVAGGSEEENFDVIQDSLSGIVSFFEMEVGRAFGSKNQSEYNKGHEEEFEQFGGNEETESHLFHFQETEKDYIINRAQDTMKEIQYAKKDLSNGEDERFPF
ncbi:MAG: hypothetical protein EZS28_032226 [Streblomastix strix]|uniref:Uncharacterized protein n=1 Tax=Streblomastix strix TaxID=222440 RepID=A0A5J4UNE6_9EUKA|nr:MAG: hypothetical protein EZS28_032226 [Streblomastix strix]